MRIGQLCLRLVVLVAVGALGSSLNAQSSNESGYRPPVFHAIDAGNSSGGPMQALFYSSRGRGASSPNVDAYGNSAVVPAGYASTCGCAECGDACGYGDYCPADCGCGGGCNGACGHGGQYSGFGGCGHNRCGTCPPPQVMGTNPPFDDYVENYSLIGPFRTEQCGPHYFDVRMETVFLTRDETFAQQVNFTSLNVVDPMMPDPGQFVVRSDQLDFDTEFGFRVVGRYDVGPLSVIEFGYMGIENLDAQSSFTDPMPVDPNSGNLYSLFSDFVQDPAALPAGVTTPDSGVLPATERSVTHSITLESELHVAEINYRRYWVGYNSRVSGTMLCGFRYTRLREDFDFTTIGEARGQYLTIAKNDLAGFQAGGDVWIHILRGLRTGAEAKVALSNNHYTLDNTFMADPAEPTPPTLVEHFEKDIPAFIAEASLDVVADLTPHWSLRAGYEIHFLNSLVLAGENFNTGTIYTGVPDVTLPPRVPFIFDQGNAFYHGGHLGAEFIW